MVILDAIVSGALLGLKIVTCSAIVIGGIIVIAALIGKDPD